MHHIKPMIIKEGYKQRQGKGFSKEELKKAGINLAEARKLKIPIDPRRNTAHEGNIETLKAHTKKSKTPV